jgi:hypothetical protein
VTNLKKAEPQPGDQRLVNAQFACLQGTIPAISSISIAGFVVGGGTGPVDIVAEECGWTKRVSLETLDNGSRVIGHWLSWGSPTTWVLSADVEEYKAQSVSANAETTYELRTGDILKISIPNADGTVAIGLGMTFTKEPFQVVLGQNSEYLELKQRIEAPNSTIFLYAVKRPLDF